MSFKRFIYFCMICGGWAAFVCWGAAEVLRLYEANTSGETFLKAGVTGAILGLLVAATIGMLDALLNAVGFTRLVRAFVCMGVGLVGGLVGALVGQGLFSALQSILGAQSMGANLGRVAGWAIVGIAVGASIGVFDLLRAVTTRAPLRQSMRKMINGMIGGTVGGVLGGIALWGMGIGFGLLFEDSGSMHSPRALGLVILGMCIGLLIGTAQVVLKEAWIKVEAGFKPGREMMLSKPETTVGRAEGVDIALFGDKDCEKLHAKVILKSGRYYLVDNGTPGGTFLNGERIGGPAPLKSGDLIQCGRSALRFGERAKRS
jgi:hypothetical protein